MILFIFVVLSIFFQSCQTPLFMPDKPIAFSLYDESYVLHKFGCLKETKEKPRVTIIQMDSSTGPELSLLFKNWPLYALLGNVLR